MAKEQPIKVCPTCRGVLCSGKCEKERVISSPTVVFTPDKLKAFKKAYTKAKGKDHFTFEGMPYVRGYAKYVIEYLEGQFSGRNTHDGTKRK